MDYDVGFGFAETFGEASCREPIPRVVVLGNVKLRCLLTFKIFI